jgi:YVTN family beta-propeller protein
MRGTRGAGAAALLAAAVLGAAAAAHADNGRGSPRGGDSGDQHGGWDGANGGPVTPAGWRIAPAGEEIGVGKSDVGFQGPLAAALTPDGRYALTPSSGASRWQSSDLFDLQEGRRTDSVPYDGKLGQSVFYGVVWSPDGQHAWVSGGGQDVVHTYHRDGSRLVADGDVGGAGLRFPAGLAYGRTPNGDRIYVANNLGGPNYAGGNPNPPGHTVSVIDPAAGGGAGAVVKTIELGDPLQPLGVAFDRTARKAYVTNWMGRSVSVIDTTTETKTTDIQLSPPDQPLQADHPSALAANPKRDEMYVANANSDTVSVIDTTSDRLAGTIDVSVVPGAAKGATPDGVDVSPDGRTLYVALAGENAIAVVDLERRATKGFIPTAWYPADVDVTPDGGRLVVTNTNDSGAGPNPCGQLQPTPPPPGCTGPDAPPEESQYSGTMIKGSMQVVQVPDDEELHQLTGEVLRNNQARTRGRRAPRAASQIKHVIYVIKENRTYDQVFGDLPRGNGDPRLTLFGDDSAPNHRALARQFTLIDNFYADAEVSADGHNWATEANATDYLDKTWPINYSPGPRNRQRGYDFEDNPAFAQFPTEPLASDPSVPRSAPAPTRGYLWDNAYDHGVSYRDYGEFTSFPGDCSQPAEARKNISSTTRLDVARFPGHVDNRFPGYNLSCSDHLDREPEWEREFDGYVAGGNLPALSFVKLPNDHTNGTVPGKATPQAYMADNDLALGRLVDKVSHSRYWKDTLILVTEDDAQNGPDHVDAHRTVALAISPYTQRHGAVDSTHYDTSSMVATTEDILGLPPMSIVDSRVNRMWGSFGGRPDFAPYTARTPSVKPYGDPAAPVNGATAAMASAAKAWDFGREDATPEIGLNRAIWKSVRGRKASMPAPRHVHIIGSRPNDEGDGGRSQG